MSSGRRWRRFWAGAELLSPKKLQNLTSELVNLVRGHLECGAFQDDVFELQAALFGFAASAMDAFAAEKAAARVVDFGDMLALAHRLLGQPAVQEALRGRLDLVLVDEFQDTSPIQLAVAAALGSLAKRSIWVGDRKRAIFAFQGSDPDLMSSAIAWALQGKPPVDGEMAPPHPSGHPALRAWANHRTPGRVVAPAASQRAPPGGGPRARRPHPVRGGQSGSRDRPRRADLTPRAVSVLGT